jgi:hypothetical protein
MTAVAAEAIQYLQESRAAQDALVKMFRTHLGITSAGKYREILERHVRQARMHVRHFDARAGELGARHGPMRLRLEFVQNLVSQTTTITKLSLDLLRSTGGRERLLSNAKDECATVAFALATHRALALVARVVGDEDTAELATAIAWDHQSLLDKLLEVINELAETAISVEIPGKPSSEFATTGAARAMRAGTRRLRNGAERGRAEVRHIPSLSQIVDEGIGARAFESDLPISNYGELTAELVIEQLPQLSQIDLDTIDGYERRHADRTAVLDEINTLRGIEPWPRYDEMTAQEICSWLHSSEAVRVGKRVLDYEYRHKNRSIVVMVAERACKYAAGGACP